MNKTTVKEILVRKFDFRIFQVYGYEAKILKDVLGLMLKKLDVDNILPFIVFYIMYYKFTQSSYMYDKKKRRDEYSVLHNMCNNSTIFLQK